MDTSFNAHITALARAKQAFAALKEELQPHVELGEYLPEQVRDDLHEFGNDLLEFGAALVATARGEEDAVIVSACLEWLFDYAVV